MLGEYEFGIASLLNKKEGDMVNFQDSQIENFALDVKSNKQKLRSHVEVVKGQFGFLSYEQDEGKKLSFHVSEVEGGEFSAGDRDLKGPLALKCKLWPCSPCMTEIVALEVQ